MKRLSPAHRETVHRVAVHTREESPRMMPPGTVVPPPGYYPPGPYARLVYGGMPRGPYGWGGYPGPYPYYEYP